MTSAADDREAALRCGDDLWGRLRAVQLRSMLMPLSIEQWDAYGRAVAADVDGDHYAGHLAACGVAVS